MTFDRMTLGVTSTYCLALFIVGLGSSFQFYNIAVVNPAQNVLERWINNTYYERDGLPLNKKDLTLFWSVVVSSVSVGAVLGTLVTRKLAESCGRRDTLVLNAGISVIGGLCATLSKYAQSPEMLILGRVILGVSLGIGSGVAPMYMMEISPVEYRGAAGTVHMLAVAFGDWFSLLLGQPTVLGSATTWPLAFGFTTIPAMILVICLPCFPKSPRYTLISLERRLEAKRTIEVFTSKRLAKKAFLDLVEEAALGKDLGNFHLRKFFENKHLRTPMMLSLVVMVAQQFTGTAALFSYSTRIFVRGEVPLATAQYATVALGLTYFLCALPTPLLIERQGRRFLILFQLCGCVCCLVLLSVLVGLRTHLGPTADWAGHGCIAALLLYFAFYGVGSPIPWMITMELFSQEHRSAAVTLSTFVSWSLAFIISIGYLPFSQVVGLHLSFLPFIVVLIAAIIWLALLMPETRGRPINHIVFDFRRRARRVSEALSRVGSRAVSRALSRAGSRAVSRAGSIVDFKGIPPDELQSLLEREKANGKGKKDEASTSKTQTPLEMSYGTVEPR